MLSNLCLPIVSVGVCRSAAFEALFGADRLEQLAEACYASHQGHIDPDVEVITTVAHNACNHTYHGCIRIDGEEIAFIFESGDVNGSVLHYFDDGSDAPMPEPDRSYTRYFFATRDAESGEFREVRAYRNQEWFDSKTREMNYDMHFAPGEKTHQHYSRWGAKRGWIIASERVAP